MHLPVMALKHQTMQYHWLSDSNTTDELEHSLPMKSRQLLKLDSLNIKQFSLLVQQKNNVKHYSIHQKENSSHLSNLSDKMEKHQLHLLLPSILILFLSMVRYKKNFVKYTQLRE